MAAANVRVFSQKLREEKTVAKPKKGQIEKRHNIVVVQGRVTQPGLYGDVRSA